MMGFCMPVQINLLSLVSPLYHHLIVFYMYTTDCRRVCEVEHRGAGTWQVSLSTIWQEVQRTWIRPETHFQQTRGEGWKREERCESFKLLLVIIHRFDSRLFFHIYAHRCRVVVLYEYRHFHCISNSLQAIFWNNYVQEPKRPMEPLFPPTQQSNNGQSYATSTPNTSYNAPPRPSYPGFPPPYGFPAPFPQA